MKKTITAVITALVLTTSATGMVQAGVEQSCKLVVEYVCKAK